MIFDVDLFPVWQWQDFFSWIVGSNVLQPTTAKLLKKWKDNQFRLASVKQKDEHLKLNVSLYSVVCIRLIHHLGIGS